MDTPLHNSSSSGGELMRTGTDMKEACVLFSTVFNSGLIGIICLLGLAGNILSLTILHSDRQNRVASFLLQALAVADTAVLVMSCFVLVLIYGILHSQTTVIADWTHFIFKYINSLGYITQGVTIWFTVLLAINRYIAVCRPLHASRLSVRGAKIQTGAVVVVSFISNMPRIFLYDISRSPPRPSPHPATENPLNLTVAEMNLSPSMLHPSQNPLMLFEILYTTLILILPLIILAGLNLRLISELQRAKRRLRHFSRSYSGSNEDNITVVMVVVIVVVVICHTPDRIIQILRWLPSDVSRTCPNWMYFVVSVSNLLIVLNSSINFLVYCVLRKRFRRILVIKIFQRRRNRASSQSASLTNRSLLRSRYTMPRKMDIVELKDTAEGDGDKRASNLFAVQSIKVSKQSLSSPTRYSIVF